MSGINKTPINPTADDLRSLREHFAKLKDDRAAIREALLALIAIDPPAYLTMNVKIIQHMYGEIIKLIDAGKLDDITIDQGKYFKRATDSIDLYGAPDRNFAIYCERDAEGKIKFRAFLDQKSKLEDNTPVDVEWEFGSSKLCKGGYEVTDLLFAPLAALLFRSKKPTNDELESIAINNEMHAIDPNHFANVVCIIDDKGLMHLFTEHADFGLHDVISMGILDADYDGFPELDRTMVETKIKVIENGVLVEKTFPIERCKLDVLYQIMEAVASLEKKLYAHNDLKDENINCFYDSVTKRLKVVISDIDSRFVKKFADSKPAYAGTDYFLPPESAVAGYKTLRAAGLSSEAAIQALTTKIKQRLQGKDGKPDKKSEHFYGLDLAVQMYGANAKDKIVQEKWEEASKGLAATAYTGKQDIWSTGRIFMNILLGNDHDPKNPLHSSLIANTIIGSMLDFDWRNRASAEQLVAKMREDDLFASVKDLDLTSYSSSSGNRGSFDILEEVSELVKDLNALTSTDPQQVTVALNNVVDYVNGLSIFTERLSQKINTAKNALEDLLNIDLSKPHALNNNANYASLLELIEEDKQFEPRLSKDESLNEEESGSEENSGKQHDRVIRGSIGDYQRNQEENFVIGLVTGVFDLLAAKMGPSNKLPQAQQDLVEKCEDFATKIAIAKAEIAEKTNFRFGRRGIGS